MMTDTQQIVLSRPITVNGVEYSTLTMREPTVEDQLAIDANKGSDSEKEIILFTNLCEVSPDVIKKLSLRDYKKIQKAFLFFTEE